MRSLLKIALVEDHGVFRETLAQHLPQSGERVVVGSYSTASAFLEALPGLELHLALMDISLPDRSGHEAAAEALAQQPDLRVLFLTSHEDTEQYRAAVQAGGHGYVPKSASLATLLEAIRIVSNGGQYFSPEQLQALAQAPTPKPPQEEPITQVLDDSLWIREQDLLVRVYFEDIRWIEADGNYSTLVTPKQTHVVVSSLRHTAAALPTSTFMRVHKSYVVNLNHISEISELSLFIHGKKIPVGRTYRAQLLERLKKL